MNAPILDKVLACPDLPSLPTVAVELLALTRDPDVDLGDIADLVQHDQGLASRILRTVNSSYYSLSQPCPTIKRALAYLGLTTVKSLVLGFSLVELSKGCRLGFDLMDYWRRCLYSAAAARRLATATGAFDPDEAFIAALMQDIGMLAMHAALGSEYDNVISETKGNHFLLPRCETATLGFTHALAGAQLGAHWNLPEQIIDPIKFHHRGAASANGSDPMVNAVILAYRISNLLTTEHRTSALAVVDAMSQALFHLSLEDERAVLELVSQDAHELAHLLDVEVGELPDIRAILADADEALVKHQLQKKQEAAGRAGPAATAVGGMEASTGIGDRAQFERELSARFESVRGGGGTLAVVLADTDRFETLVETFGKPAGEEVLQHIGSLLLQGIGSAGLVYRLAGQKFAVLIPGADGTRASRTADQLRKSVEGQQIALRGPATRFAHATASFGVAAIDAELADRLNRPGLLLQLAEKALYAAKTAGRNCVRVFNPTPPKSSAA